MQKFSCGQLGGETREIGCAVWSESSVGVGTDVGAIMVVVAYESYERVLKIAHALSYKKEQREIEMQIIKRMSRADPNNTRLSVILRR